MVNGNGTSDDPLIICSEDFISKSITIIGYNGKPRVVCDKTDHHAILKFTSSAYSTMYRFYHETVQSPRHEKNNTGRPQNRTEYDTNGHHDGNKTTDLELHLFSCISQSYSLRQCYDLWNNHGDISVVIQNVNFINGYILASDITVSIVMCDFEESSIYFSMMPHSTNQVQFKPFSDQLIQCKSMHINIVNTNMISNNNSKNDSLGSRATSKSPCSCRKPG